MNEAEAFERVVKILTPHVRNQEALEGVNQETNILDDLIDDRSLSDRSYGHHPSIYSVELERVFEGAVATVECPGGRVGVEEITGSG